MPDQAATGSTPSTLDAQLLHFERYLITEALANCNGRAVNASERLGIPKKTLYDKMKRLELSPQDFKVD
jgi:two-component system C4-dicarboxylate transport response regulator DctD